MTEATGAKAYYRGLDGLRAFAVALVMLGHGGAPGIRSGGVGVDVFFVLSGFLITSILAAEHRATGRICLRNFYARRLLRLVPCLVLTAATYWTVVRFATGEWPNTTVVIALSYCANWMRAVTTYDMGSLGHCWSLAIEEQFYVVWPFVVLALERATPRTAVKGAILLGAAMALAVYRAGMVGSFEPERIYFGLDTHMDGLVLGSALSYGVATWRARGGPGRAVARAWSWLLVPAAFAALLGTAHELTWIDAGMQRFGFLGSAIAAAVVVGSLVLVDGSWLARAFGRPLPVYVGRISYGLYLWHYPVFHAMDQVLRSAPLLLVWKLLASGAIAVASFELVEKRFLRMKALFERAPGKAAARDASMAHPT